MKKIISYILTLLLSFLFVDAVYASSFDLKVVGDSEFTDKITLYLEVDSFEDLDKDLFYGLTAKLEYDVAKLNLEKIEPLSDFKYYKDSYIVLYNSKGVKENTKILKLEFSNRGLNDGEETIVSIKNITGSDSTVDIGIVDINYVITFKEEVKEENPDNSGNNGVDGSTGVADDGVGDSDGSITPSDDEEKKPTTTTTTKKKSKNNYISKISLSSGKIDFDKDNLHYSIIVSHDTETIDINVDLAHSKAKISGDGTHELKVGKNTIELKVTAENGTTRTYTIEVEREELKEVVDDQTNEDNDTNNLPLIIGITCFVVAVIVLIIYFVYKNKDINKK